MKHFQEHFDWAVRIVLSLLVLLFLGLCVTLFFQYQRLRHDQMIGPHAPWFPSQGRGGVPSDVNLVQSWMTYDYVGHIYHLPQDYLKTTLSLKTTYYPRVSISASAAVQGTSSAALTTDVKKAIQDYLVSNPQ